MPEETTTIGPYSDEHLAKLSELTYRVFSVFQQFQVENPDITEDLIMRNLAFDIGTWIALKHEHWFRSEAKHSLKFYESCIQMGLDAGIERWDKPKGEGLYNGTKSP